MVQVPFFLAVTLPLAFTLAIFGLSLVNLRVLACLMGRSFVFLTLVTFPLITYVLPFFKTTEDFLSFRLLGLVNLPLTFPVKKWPALLTFRTILKLFPFLSDENTFLRLIVCFLFLLTEIALFSSFRQVQISSLRLIIMIFPFLSEAGGRGLLIHYSLTIASPHMWDFTVDVTMCYIIWEN